MKKIIIEKSDKLQKLPPAPFLEAERAKHGLVRRGVEVIDLGELNPDPSLREFFMPSADRSDIFTPADSNMLTELKNQIGKWLEQRYGLKVKSQKVIFPFFSDQRVIYHLLLGFLNPVEKVAVLDPCDPIYKRASVLAGAEVESIPLLERNDYLPNLAALFPSLLDSVERRTKFRILHSTKAKIPQKVAFPKILFLNYPHNPTTSVADPAFFREVVKWAGQNNVLVVNDASGNEICYDDNAPVSLLQTKGARKLAVEKFSFWGLTGIEFGFLVGDKGIISCVESVEGAIGQRVSMASALLAREILRNYPQIAQKNNQEFASRKEVLMKGLFDLGWKVKKPKAGPFLWVKIPPKYSSVGFSRMILRKTGVLVSPGFGFGELGEGYIRIALNQPKDQLQIALERMKKHSHIWQRRFRTKKPMANDE